MQRRDFLSFAAAFAAAAARADETAAPDAVSHALVGGRLLDGYGGPPVEDSVILLSGERISAVGRMGELPVPAQATQLSTEGCTVLPGLADLYVHLARLGHGDPARWDSVYLPLAQRVVTPAAARALLLAGVTTVRDVGTPLEAAIEVRERIRAQRIPGPTVYVGGPQLEHDPPPAQRSYRWSINGEKEARERVARLAAAGVDFVTVADLMRISGPELAALVQAAHDKALQVHAVIGADAEIARAIAAGVDGLLSLGASAEPLPSEALAAFESRARRGSPVLLVPALAPVENLAWLRENHGPLDDPHWREGLPPLVADDLRESLRDLNTVGAEYEPLALRRAAQGGRARAARDAGALLVVGSAAGAPAQLLPRATWQEMEAWVRAELATPMEVIRRATYWPALALGVPHESGAVAPGKYADILVVRGDVLRHIDRLADVEFVFRRGVRHR
jgi:imidazolonepropionase-like amidohydrolase